MKAQIVSRDETEQGERALLNLGHTFGHAFEAWCGYSDRLLHGEAISIGMCLAFKFSAELGHCASSDAERVAAHFAAVGLPTLISDIPGAKPDVPALMRLMQQDKKVRQGKLTFILARGIGAAFIARDVAPERVSAFLARQIG
jgi:3-dehydroquinate synthetase